LIGIGIPLETANFLLVMTRQLADILFGYSGITMEDGSVSRARREDVVVPCECTHSAGVARHGTDLATVFGIPDLDCTLVGT
jgi:hypothetical protein